MQGDPAAVRVPAQVGLIGARAVRQRVRPGGQVPTARGWRSAAGTLGRGAPIRSTAYTRRTRARATARPYQETEVADPLPGSSSSGGAGRRR
ncbi:hypothetical protein [Streptomyces broussonetiae]|uniref:hypothetical protein n=1 Tax=Streptomyces broussonetiae TaxID=2686304 RepID=UPI0035DE1BD2